MGRTIPSYRIATAMERSKWKIFRQRLDKKDRKSKIYEVFGLYQVTGIDSDHQEFTGNTYISLGEDLNLGDGINDKEYQTNGTVIWKNDRKNAELSIHGDRVQN